MPYAAATRQETPPTANPARTAGFRDPADGRATDGRAAEEHDRLDGEDAAPHHRGGAQLDDGVRRRDAADVAQPTPNPIGNAIHSVGAAASSSIVTP